MQLGVTTFAAIAFPTICHGNSSTNEDHKSCNYEYFHNAGFHALFLLTLNLIRLDWTGEGRVYTGLWKGREPGSLRRLTPIPARSTFQSDCMDGFRCRESPTIRFRHLNRLVIRGGLVNLLIQATSYLSSSRAEGLNNVRTLCTVQPVA